MKLALVIAMAYLLCMTRPSASQGTTTADETTVADSTTVRTTADSTTNDTTPDIGSMKCFAESTGNNKLECENGKFGKIWEGCIDQGSIRVRCPRRTKPCNDAARNGKEFSCYGNCKNHGGDKKCTLDATTTEPTSDRTTAANSTAIGTTEADSTTS